MAYLLCDLVNLRFCFEPADTTIGKPIGATSAVDRGPSSPIGSTEDLRKDILSLLGEEFYFEFLFIQSESFVQVERPLFLSTKSINRRPERENAEATLFTPQPMEMPVIIRFKSQDLT